METSSSPPLFGTFIIPNNHGQFGAIFNIKIGSRETLDWLISPKGDPFDWNV